MTSLRNNVWLIVGALAAVVAAGLRPGQVLPAALGDLMPLPWGAVGVGLGVFAVFSVLHFRLRLVQAMEEHRDDLERGAAASRLILSAVADGRRWLRVVQENLELVADDAQADRERQLYLSGARAHADKLEQAFERIEGNQRQLDRSAGGAS